MKIQNFNELAVSDLRKAALNIAEAGLLAIDTKEALKRAVKVGDGKLYINGSEFELNNSGKLLVVGVGKCSLEAGAALEEILGDRISGGIIVDVHKGTLRKIETYRGTHPLPSEQNVDATKKIIELLSGRNEKDLVIFVVSGGGSTLLCQPVNHTCAEEAKIFQCLSAAGATIQELNTVRKHISLARGGFLAKYAYPARVVSLIFSDVPGNNLEFVASGPTVRDTTSIAEAEKVIEKYDVRKKCDLPRSEKPSLLRGLPPNILIETPKNEEYFRKVKNILLVSNDVALGAMAEEAKKQGFSPQIVTDVMVGESRNVAGQILKSLERSEPKTVLLYGGETTVTIKGTGRGGRNLELALAALKGIGDGELILTLASDGRDNGEFAGAICDTITLEATEKSGYKVDKALENNDSYGFFEKAGNYVLTGDTGSNVSDLVVAIK
jgi:glycerate-2-kinase